MSVKRALIVEDEGIVQLHLRQVLKRSGFEVAGVASTAQEAIDQAAAVQPHLVLMDIRLHGDRDGIDATRALKALCDAAVVFVTAYADEETVERARQAGAAGYIVKPFSEAQVRAVLATAFAGQENLRRVVERGRSLSTILHSLGEAVVVVDAHGAISYVNPPALRLAGRNEELALDRTLEEVFTTATGALAEAVKRSGISGTSGRFSNVEIVSPDGTRRIVEGEVEPLLDLDGSRRGTVVVMREVSSLPETARARGRITYRPFGAGTRMLIYSHDTFGLGHLRRSLNIARALVSKYPDLSILIVTGSTVVHQFKLPPGVDYVKLPAVRKVAPEQYRSRLLRMSDEGILRLRTNILLRTIRDYEPNVLLVDHSPIGMKGEMRLSLDWLREPGGPCISVVGLRDVIDDPSTVVNLWERKGVYDVLRSQYDHVIVYGSRDVFDTAAAYRFPPEVQASTRFLGYITEAPEHTGAEPVCERTSPRPLIVVTIGGGDGAAEIVVGTYLRMVREHPEEFESIVLTGPFVTADLAEAFRKASEGLPVSIRWFVSSTVPFLESADLVITTGGYNSATGALRYARRAIIIPQIEHRQEQLIRAQRLADLAGVALLHPDEVTPDRLYREVSAQLSSSREPVAEARVRGAVPLDGAERLVDFFGSLMIPCTQPQETVNE